MSSPPASAASNPAPSFAARLFIVPALLACLDYRVPGLGGLSIPTLMMIAAPAAAAVWALAEDRAGPFGRRAGVWAAGIALSFLIAWAMWDEADRFPDAGETAARVLRSPSSWFWAAALWFAAPCFLPGSPHGRGFKTGLALLLLHGALAFGGAVASKSPDISLREFALDRALPIMALTAWLRASAGRPRVRTETAGAVLAWMSLLAMISCAAGLVWLAGGAELRASMEQAGFVFAESPEAGPGIPARRLMFPMMDFNRNAYFMLILLLGLAAAFAARRAERAGEGAKGRDPAAGAILLAMIPAAAALVLSFTRGIAAAALAGGAVIALLTGRRTRIAAVSILAAGLAGLVLVHPRYFLSALEKETYFPPPGRTTSMQSRFEAWDLGGAIAAAHPWTGVGYGTAVVRDELDRRLRRRGYVSEELAAAGRRLQHLHNVWIETAAETGLPSAAMLAAFTLWRWRLLLRRRRAPAPGPRRAVFDAWLALELGIFIAGLLFYMIRRNFGALTLWTWGAAFAAAAEETAGPGAGASAVPKEAASA